MLNHYPLHLIFSRPAFYAFFMGMTWLLAGCTEQCEGIYTYKVYEPVYLNRSELLQTVGSQAPRVLSKTGKIYTVGSYILINEQNQGIHVIDNSNPKAPQNISFISVPGNVDIAVRNQVLYADAATDLLALDFTNPESVKILKHLEDVFEPTVLINGNGMYVINDNTKGLLVDYKERLVTEKRNCNEIPGNTIPANPNGVWMEDGGLFYANSNIKSNSAGGPTGTGGSMARFTINDNYLYTVGNNKMEIFNLDSPGNPQKKEPVFLGSGIETIFPYQDKLFIGSNSGMFIYSIANPAAPTYLGGYSHLRACDPVVVEGNYAYVTLRTSNNTARCGPSNANQLDVVDISNPQAPQVRRTYPMQNPHGLGINNSTLFICEGNYGLKVFNAGDPDKIAENMLSHLGNLQAFDVIPLGKNLLVIGEGGFYQYDYSDPKRLKFLSKIAVAKN